MAARRASGWEPSEQAETLKREYARIKKRRNRWGDNVLHAPSSSSLVVAGGPPAEPESPMETAQARVNEINALLKGMSPELEQERAMLNAERQELVKAIIAQKFGGGGAGPALARPRQAMVKLPLPDNTCPGGAGNLIGLIIGPRGKTQQRLQNESGCVIVVRGKGASRRADGMIDEEEEEETHVRITGPSEEACNRAKAAIEVLIDFNSDEGEKLREAQHRQLKVLNGTLNEDKEIEYKRLFTNPQRAADVGPLGQARPTPAALPAPVHFTPSNLGTVALTTASVASAPSAAHEDEYAKMMAEIGSLDGSPGAAVPAPPPAGMAMPPHAAAPPPRAAPPRYPPPAGYAPQPQPPQPQPPQPQGYMQMIPPPPPQQQQPQMQQQHMQQMQQQQQYWQMQQQHMQQQMQMQRPPGAMQMGGGGMNPGVQMGMGMGMAPSYAQMNGGGYGARAPPPQGMMGGAGGYGMGGYGMTPPGHGPPAGYGTGGGTGGGMNGGGGAGTYGMAGAPGGGQLSMPAGLGQLQMPKNMGGHPSY